MEMDQVSAETMWTWLRDSFLALKGFSSWCLLKYSCIIATPQLRQQQALITCQLSGNIYFPLAFPPMINLPTPD